MSGMKNYLVKHGEREFEKEVEKERLKVRMPNASENIFLFYELFLHSKYLFVYISRIADVNGTINCNVNNITIFRSIRRR